MSFSGPHAKRRGKSGELSIDLTPLIDVVFQLLIFFVLTSTFQTNPSFRVKLPKAKNRDVTQDPKALVVTVAQDGRIELDGKAVDERELQMRMCAAAQDDSGTGVNIRADEATQHQFVIRVMDAARGCGLEKLGILHGR